MTFFYKKLTTGKVIFYNGMAIFLRINNTFWVSVVSPARQNRQFCRQKVRRQKCFLAFFFVGSVVIFVFCFSSSEDFFTTDLQRIFMNLQRIFPNLQRIVLSARLIWLGSHRCFSVFADFFWWFFYDFESICPDFCVFCPLKWLGSHRCFSDLERPVFTTGF